MIFCLLFSLRGFIAHLPLVFYLLPVTLLDLILLLLHLDEAKHYLALPTVDLLA